MDERATAPEDRVMTRTSLTFGELVDTVQRAGFDLRDARDLDIAGELQPMLEDGNLMAEIARVELRPAPEGARRGVVADILVRDQVFRVWGEFSRAGELEHLLAGSAASPHSSPIGEPPES